MNRIIAVSMVKNESDVIESFCRHNLGICDMLLICDDNSADETKEILLKLVDEGLNIILFDNSGTIGHYQEQIITRMARMAVETYDADIVVPLDADEFLHCTDGNDPRAILQGLKDDTGHWLLWPFCLPPSKPLENGVFLPAQFDQYIYQANVFKLAVGAKMLKGDEFMITRGNHYLQSTIDQNVYGGPVAESLRLAHYPIRSAEQAMTKAIVGWVGEMCTIGRPEGASVHWQRMYNIIKETGYLKAEHLLELCQQYMFSNAPIAPAAHYTVNSDIQLKYTDYNKAQKNFLKIILTNYEHVIQRLMSQGAVYSVSESMKAVAGS